MSIGTELFERWVKPLCVAIVIAAVCAGAVAAAVILATYIWCGGHIGGH